MRPLYHWPLCEMREHKATNHTFQTSPQIKTDCTAAQIVSEQRKQCFTAHRRPLEYNYKHYTKTSKHDTLISIQWISQFQKKTSTPRTHDDGVHCSKEIPTNRQPTNCMNLVRRNNIILQPLKGICISLDNKKERRPIHSALKYNRVIWIT